MRAWSWTTRTGQLAPEITVRVPVPVPRRAEDCDEQRASKTLHPAYTFPCVERRTGLDSPSFLDERCLRLWVRTPAGSPSRQFPTALLYSHHPLIYTLARKSHKPPSVQLAIPVSSTPALLPTLLRSRCRRTRHPQTTPCLRRRPPPRAQHSAGTRSVSSILPPSLHLIIPLYVALPLGLPLLQKAETRMCTPLRTSSAP